MGWFVEWQVLRGFLMKREYGRTTITVPARLQEEMRNTRTRVNWSAIACQAFEKKLEELGTVQDITSVQGAIERMKSLNEQEPTLIDRERQSGKSAGIDWAMNDAHPSQIQRIEDFRHTVPDDEWSELMISGDGWRQLAKCIEPRSRQPRGRGSRAIEIGPIHEGDWDDIGPGFFRHRRGSAGHEPVPGPCRETAVWRSILNRRPDHQEFFLGFAEGVLEVWKQVKDKL
jgi:hypothetical protein